MVIERLSTNSLCARQQTGAHRGPVLDSPTFTAVRQVSATTWSYGSSLTDPPGSSVLVASVDWLEGTLLGTIATTIAVISVASIGLMVLPAGWT
ncbi:hypothetical protein [Sphingomonas sp. 7/4-4]|uniref:hypothetical protein n=1 Tax=Sphingomonas sp. 7/4-4 TaxID=3018446 RepID=UPI00300DC103